MGATVCVMALAKLAKACTTIPWLSRLMQVCSCAIQKFFQMSLYRARACTATALQNGRFELQASPSQYFSVWY
ncbi:hypothetical protein KC19_VG279700 [Ceratodon purpureus]|uniref:Secreted protein n=1 Tax=Ceratodon purpureus TaxID=3225 RepID=A0A8T0HW44_CERPU|nr:hypothetical protein KC19_VG279700 [Ceratodon purpureus]